MNLQDKVIVITGGGRGLGRSMALELAKSGVKLALVDLNQDDLDESVLKATELGCEARSYLCNVTNEADVENLFSDIIEDFGAIDGLVNNAGVTRDALFVKVDRETGKVVNKMSMDQWNLVLDVNLTGTFLCAREAAVQMINHGTKGCIINISSISRAGNMGQTNYTATKSAVEAMSVTWAKELARYGIRAASVAPGFIGTEMVLGMKPEALSKITANIPAGRLGTPEEIAATIKFIFENDYVNGRCMEVDGALRI